MRSFLKPHTHVITTVCAPLRPRTSPCEYRNLAFAREYSVTGSKKHDEQQHIAVLGGGITGLVTAFYIAEGLPSARVTLFNATKKLGGWLQSEWVDTGTGKVLFEQGPRTLRPAPISGWVTLQLIKDLGIEDQILSTSKNSVAAQNRYVYYPDHLVRMPGPGVSVFENISNFITEPIFRGVLRGVGKDLTTKPRPELRDETVADFISRRFDNRIASNILSAIIHGIYAGDIHQLSTRTLFPRLWDYERMTRRKGLLGLTDGSVFPRFFGKYAGTTQIARGDLPLLNELDRSIKECEILHKTSGSSVYTFKNGIGTLSTTLEDRLRNMTNVEIQTQTYAQFHTSDISEKGSKLKLECKPLDGPPTIIPITHCIYACRHPLLPSGFCPSSTTNQKIQRSGHTSTVMVINLYYPSSSLLHNHGFGYLIPQSVPQSQNPERALGVVFDSDATIGQDDIPDGGLRGTKLTVMLGGHYWNSLIEKGKDFPNEEQGATMARAVLARHLNITAPPSAIRVSLQKDCIPQYLLHHDDVMSQGDAYLLRTYGGRVRVGGSPYTGVGLNDCVKAGRDLARGVVEGDKEGGTGLEMFRGDRGREWQYVKFIKEEGRWVDVAGDGEVGKS